MRRDRQFNQRFKTLIRVTAEDFDNSPVAYAMDKIGRLIPEIEPGTDESPLPRERQDAQPEYSSMSPEEQDARMESLKMYPTIEKVLQARRHTAS